MEPQLICVSFCWARSFPLYSYEESPSFSVYRRSSHWSITTPTGTPKYLVKYGFSQGFLFYCCACTCFLWIFYRVEEIYFSSCPKSCLFRIFADSVRQAFTLPDDKKQKFASLRDSLIQLKAVPVKSLQKFAGKVISFSLAVPAAKLFCREVNYNIGKGLKSSKPAVMPDALKRELEHWKFLDSWSGFLPWRSERHFFIEITTDPSNSGWGGILTLPDNLKSTRDYWCPEDLDSPGGNAVKEAKAFLHTLSTFSSEVFNGRVDAYVDNKNLLGFWNNEGGKSIPLTNEIKDLFFMTLKLNIILNLHYVPSTFNNADTPFRFSSDIDCSLSDNAWFLVETLFGPHSFDMMAIPSNVKKSKNGEKLILILFSSPRCRISRS